jgi:hypothetical protein
LARSCAEQSVCALRQKSSDRVSTSTNTARKAISLPDNYYEQDFFDTKKQLATLKRYPAFQLIFGRVEEACGAAWPLSALSSVSESSVLPMGLSEASEGSARPETAGKVNSTKENT